MHAAIVFLVGALLVGLPAWAQPQRERGLRVVQSINGANLSSVKSEIVRVTFGAAAVSAPAFEAVATAGVDLASTRISVPFTVIPRGTLTKGDIESQARSVLTPALAATVAERLRVAMAQIKVGTAAFVFEQSVWAGVPAAVEASDGRCRWMGAPFATRICLRRFGLLDRSTVTMTSVREMKLVWSVTVMEGGRYFAGDAKVTDPDPTIVYLSYVSLTPAQGLPPDWKLPSAGVMRYQIRKRDGTPTTDWEEIDTAGAFDEVAADSEFMVKCLVDSATAGCPAGYPDAKALMQDSGSVASVIDYARQVSPVYDESTDAAGQTIYTARTSVSYDQRSFVEDGCDVGVYRNVGRRGYLLKTVIDRYQMGAEDRSPVKVNRFEATAPSSDDSFDLSLPAVANDSALTGLVIDDETRQLVQASSVLGLQYLAPVNKTVFTQPALDLVAGTWAGDMNTTVSGDGSGNYVLQFGTIGDNYWSGGQHDRIFQFSVTNTSQIRRFALTRVAFDDWLLVRINGSVVYVGPFGGDRLLSVDYCDSGWLLGDFSSCYSYVQYCETCTGGYELKRNWEISLAIDLKPYLRSGSNEIFMRTIVGGRGEGNLRIEAQTCGK